MCRISIVSSVQGGPGWTMVQLGRTGRRVAEVGGGGEEAAERCRIRGEKAASQRQGTAQQFLSPKKTDALRALL